MSFLNSLFNGLLFLIGRLIWIGYSLGVVGLVLVCLMLWVCIGSLGGSYWMMITGH